MRETRPTYFREVQNSKGIGAEYVLPLSTLYTENRYGSLSSKRVDLGEGRAIEVALRETFKNAGSGTRQMMGVYLNVEGDSDVLHAYEYGAVYAPGRFFPEKGLKRHEAQVDLEKGTLRHLQASYPKEPRFFPALTKVKIDGKEEELITGVPRDILGGALILLGDDIPGITLEEREIMSLLLVQGAVQALGQLHEAGFTHGHPHAGNFHVTEELRVHLLDFDLVEPIQFPHEIIEDIAFMQDRIFSNDFNRYWAMKSAGLHGASTLADVTQRLEELSQQYGIDIHNEATMEDLRDKFYNAKVYNILRTVIRRHVSFDQTISPKNIADTRAAIEYVIETAPTILLDTVQQAA